MNRLIGIAAARSADGWSDRLRHGRRPSRGEGTSARCGHGCSCFCDRHHRAARSRRRCCRTGIRVDLESNRRDDCRDTRQGRRPSACRRCFDHVGCPRCHRADGTGAVQCGRRRKGAGARPNGAERGRGRTSAWPRHRRSASRHCTHGIQPPIRNGTRPRPACRRPRRVSPALRRPSKRLRRTWHRRARRSASRRRPNPSSPCGPRSTA